MKNTTRREEDLRLGDSTDGVDYRLRDNYNFELVNALILRLQDPAHPWIFDPSAPRCTWATRLADHYPEIVFSGRRSWSYLKTNIKDAVGFHGAFTYALFESPLRGGKSVGDFEVFGIQFQGSIARRWVSDNPIFLQSCASLQITDVNL